MENKHSSSGEHETVVPPSMHAPAKNTLCSSRKRRISCLDVKFISLDTAEHSSICRGTVAFSSWRYMSLPLLDRDVMTEERTRIGEIDGVHAILSSDHG